MLGLSARNLIVIFNNIDCALNHLRCELKLKGFPDYFPCSDVLLHCIHFTCLPGIVFQESLQSVGVLTNATGEVSSQQVRVYVGYIYLINPDSAVRVSQFYWIDETEGPGRGLRREIILAM